MLPSPLLRRPAVANVDRSTYIQAFVHVTHSSVGASAGRAEELFQVVVEVVPICNAAEDEAMGIQEHGERTGVTAQGREAAIGACRTRHGTETRLIGSSADALIAIDCR